MLQMRRPARCPQQDRGAIADVLVWVGMDGCSLISQLIRLICVPCPMVQSPSSIMIDEYGRGCFVEHKGSWDALSFDVVGCHLMGGCAPLRMRSWFVCGSEGCCVDTSKVTKPRFRSCFKSDRPYGGFMMRVFAC